MRRLIKFGSPAVAGVLLLSGCGVGSSNVASAPLSNPGTTWNKAYTATTCAEFKTWMTEDQRITAATDMLASERTRAGASKVAPAELAAAFQQGIHNGCAMQAVSIAETGRMLYKTNTTQFGA